MMLFQILYIRILEDLWQLLVVEATFEPFHSFTIATYTQVHFWDLARGAFARFRFHQIHCTIIN